MRRALRRARSRAGEEDGLTLVELLVASAMSVVLVGAVMSMLIGAMRAQPDVSERAQDISSARWVMERLTREIRNGVSVEDASASTFTLVTYLRRTSCGSGTPSGSATPAIRCRVTYQCTTTSCTRSEGPESGPMGAPSTLFTGINSASVFCYAPSTELDPLTCGTAVSKEETTYVGVRLQMPNPDENATALTVSDGASLRNATLLK